MRVRTYRTGRGLYVCAGMMLLCAGAPRGVAGQVTAHWLAPMSGLWTDASRWSSAPFFPNAGNPAGTTYRVVLDQVGAPHTITFDTIGAIDELQMLSPDVTLRLVAGQLTIHEASVIQSGTIRVDGGTLRGAGDLTVHSELRWGGGLLQGAGATTISQSGRFIVEGSAFQTLARRIDNYGEAEWRSGDWALITGGTFRNHGLMTIDTTMGDLAAFSLPGNQGDMRNNGTVRKVGSGVATFNAGDGGAALQNDGLIEVLEGSLRLLDSESHTGDFHAAAGATLEFGSTQSFVAGSDWTGAGTFVVQGEGSLGSDLTHWGEVDVGALHGVDGDAEFRGAVRVESLLVNGGALRFRDALELTNAGLIEVHAGELDLGTVDRALGRFAMTGGYIRSDGESTFTGASQWMDGSLIGLGEFRFDAASDVLVAPSYVDVGADVLNEGVFRVMGGGLIISSGVEFRNEGLFRMDGAEALRLPGGGVFVNTGEFEKSGSGTGSAKLFTNDGLVRVVGGLMHFEQGGDHAGTFDIADGASVRLSGAHRTRAASMIVGEGLLSLTGTWMSEGIVDLGSIALQLGAATFTGSLSVGELSVTGGSHVASGPAQIDSLVMQSGTLRFDAAGGADALAWTGGVLGGLIINPGAAATLAGGLSVTTGGLVNEGSVVAASGTLNASVGGVVNRGDWTIGDGWKGIATAGGGGFSNEGLWIKTGAGTAEIGSINGVRFENSGEVQVQGGTLRINSLLENSGSMQIASGASVEVRGGSEFAAGSMAGGLGTLRLVDLTHEFGAGEHQLGGVALSSDAVLTGAGDVDVVDLEWSTGVMSGSGRTVVLEGGLLSFVNIGDAERTLSRTLENRGSATLSDSALTIDGGTLLNVGEMSLFDGAALVGGGSGGQFINNGVVRVFGPGTISLFGGSLAMDNAGTIVVESGGRLLVDSEGTNFGVISGPGALQFAAGAGGVVQAEEIDVGRIIVSGGSHAFGANVRADQWTFSGGQATMLSPFVGLGQLSVSGTDLHLSLGATFNEDGALLVTGLGSVTFGVAVEAPTFIFGGGRIDGAADLSVTRSMSWVGGVMEGEGRTILESGASGVVQGIGPLRLRREFVNRGELTLRGAPLRLDGGALRNEGLMLVEVYPGAPMSIFADASGGVFVNAGTLLKEGEGTLRILSNGAGIVFENSGEIDVRDGLLQTDAPDGLRNEGVVRVGNRAAVEVFSKYASAADAELAFEVGGMKDRGLSGLMTITGEASLAGALSVTTPEAFSATWGDRWVVMTYGSVEGDFDVFDLPTEGFASRSEDFGASDLRWYAERGETEYAVGVSHIADIDHDGLIGFADLNVIASNFNAFGSWADGDVDGDGFVGFTDLNVVLSLFNVAAPRSVPGPGAAALLVGAGVLVGRRRRGE